MRIHFTNLGCKLNQAEIENLSRRFEARGHTVVELLEEADLHVVNSCSVTHVAARASRKAAGRAARRGGLRTVRTVLTGCYATERPAEAAGIAGVDLVVPNRDKERLVELVHGAFAEAALPAGEPSALGDTLPAGHTRAMVKVEDGCNMACSFCIIPSLRGRQRSRPVAQVVDEVRQRIAGGAREIVLTGVQISAFRDGAARLPELVEALLGSALSGEQRLRLTSIAPWDLDGPLLELWRDPRLCRHLHLSLQSGDGDTLRRMRRPYTAERFAERVAATRAAIPGVAITTDVIVGFPGESEARFAASLAFTAAQGFAKVHAFPYSPRPGTAAAEAGDTVPPEEKKERMARMLAVARAGEREFWRSHLGSRQTVLWEKPRGGRGHGLTDNYIRVLCDEGAGLWNRFSPVDLVAIATGGDGEEVGMAGKIAS
jgi:threonylcarbamoyladenosine tRNA methylthiotransferase MtaB